MKHLSQILIIFLFLSLLSNAQTVKNTLYVNGSDLLTPCGEKVVLRGVNKMIIWTADLQLRHDSYSEIRKTGANCMRIVWLANPDNNIVDGGVDALDRNIQDCIDNNMIPIVELHDATGDWSGLQNCTNFWTSPDVIKVVNKHEKYLIINIANECGDDQVTDEQFKSGYITVVQQIRNSGIKCPLIIDAADWGKNLSQIRNVAQSIINSDQERNLIFSVHTYWAIEDGANADYIKQEFQSTIDLKIPFIVGEFTDLFNKGAACEYHTDYKTILSFCQEHEIGWIAWEWGPGNEYFDKSCEIMNMTIDGYYKNLKDSWAKEVALSSNNSIKSTSITSKYILNGAKCALESVNNIEQNIMFDLNVTPNPAFEESIISLKVQKQTKVSLKIFDMLGKQIESIADGTFEPGIYKFNFSKSKSNENQLFNCIATIDGYVQSVRLIYLAK